MNAQTEAAYRRWRRLAEKGYGETTSPSAMAKIDERIRRAKANYERLLETEKREGR